MEKEKKMVNQEKLPWEMIEEVLSRVPPKSLAYFRTVSKKWSALFEDEIFIKNHKSTFQFILATKSKIFSVSIIGNFEIVMRELTLDIPGLESQIPTNLVDCNELVLCHMDKGVVVWNPWLKQTTVIKAEPSLIFRSIGIGYDRNRRVKENSYDTIASYRTDLVPNRTCWTIHEFATNAWKDRKSKSGSDDDDNNHGIKYPVIKTSNGVSLNGNMYWVTYFDKADPLYYYVHGYNFSSKSFFELCELPCLKNHPLDAIALKVFKGDQLSFLKQCHVTKKIEIWVTTDKVNDDDVDWKTFMEVSIPNLPALVQVGSDSQPSYFIEDKTVVICCCDETGRAWIYVMAENKLIRKIKIESVVDPWPLHCTYFPSFVPVLQGPREEAELQI